MEMHEMTAWELAGLLQTGEVSAREVVAASYDRIDAVEESLKAFITLTPEAALAQAERADHGARV